MARTQVEYEGSPEGLRTVAAQKVSGVRARFDPRSSSAFQLAEALGAAGPAFQDIGTNIYKKAEAEQMLKLESYKAQFLADYEGGAVTQAQLKEVFPELVPTVRARVMESIGQEQGKQYVADLINEINTSDDLRLDSVRRTQYINQKKAEILQSIGQGDDFAVAGIAKGIEREINQWENSWMRETAQYHEQVQANAFSEEVSSALQAGGDLEAVDAKWKSSSSLNNLERNKLVVQTAIQQAFANNDTSVLDRIPDRFLNAETKADLAQARNQVQSTRLAKLREFDYYQERARKEQTRQAKAQIIQDRAAGRAISPEQYLNNPDVYQFALQTQNLGTVPSYQSAAEAQRARSTILEYTQATPLDQDEVIDAIASNPNINPEDKAKLINDVPQLLEGRVILDDPMVKSAFQNQLNSRLDLLEKSIPGVLAATTQGRSLRADAQKAYDLDLRSRFQAYWEDNGQWPKGKAKQDIIDEATDRAGKLIESQIQSIMRGGAAGTPTTSPMNTQSQPAGAPQVGDVINGFRFKGGNPADRNNWEKV